MADKTGALSGEIGLWGVYPLRILIYWMNISRGKSWSGDGELPDALLKYYGESQLVA